MPYLNEAKIIGHMAHEPEMSMLANGVPYCYFAIRMVQRTPDGEVSEDFIRVIAYGDMAVTVARDIRMGDLVLCNGRLSPKHRQSPSRTRRRPRRPLSDAGRTGSSTATPIGSVG